MPYYVYRITVLGPVRRLQRLGVFAAYVDAGAECRRQREGGGAPDAPGTLVRMIFAQNELQAEELLSEERSSESNIAEDY